MKRLLSILLIVVMLLGLTACGAAPEATEPTPAEGERVDKYEQLCVDIGVNEDGYYGMWADVEIHYMEDGSPDWIYIDDPTLLAFCVSSERGGGVYLLDLDDGNRAIDELSAIAEALKTAGLTEYAERIDAIIQIIAYSGPFTQAST